MSINNEMCYCGREKDFEDCCGSIIKGITKAITAEHLMRSRYTAYATGSGNYILASTHFSTRRNYSLKDIETWAKSCEWMKLEIISSINGQKNHFNGHVEFKAYFKDEYGGNQVHHERSDFVKESGIWYYINGKVLVNNN